MKKLWIVLAAVVLVALFATCSLVDSEDDDRPVHRQFYERYK